MANSTKTSKYGKYVCRVGDYDIRHKIRQPERKKNRMTGTIGSKPGSVEALIYKAGSKKLVRSGFKDHREAMVEAAKMQGITLK